MYKRAYTTQLNNNHTSRDYYDVTNDHVKRLTPKQIYSFEIFWFIANANCASEMEKKLRVHVLIKLMSHDI